ncbi:hypothetical protein EJ110_NYTH28127 [Nymphaea thermarum]|nr:hypothetical protein EJ110_NYTH28127 [Nymphaea thermarum]
MERKKQSLKTIQTAIEQLIEEEREDSGASDSHVFTDEEDRLLLSRLLSQIESLKAGTEHYLSASVTHKTASESTEPSEVCSMDDSQSIEKPAMAEEILKELRKVKRQNHTTHWLLSIMIVATAVWQLSEFSLLYLLKQKISDPFRAVGGLLFGRLKRALVDADKSEMIPTVETPLIQLPKIPELPPVDFSYLVPSNEEN